jgi:hypothetical protein
MPAPNSTPWQVLCPNHGKVALTKEQYIAQMSAPDRLWICPHCGELAPWDDDNYEKHYNNIQE